MHHFWRVIQHFDIKTGNRSYSEVIKEAIETVSKEGLTVTYHPSGHKDTIETAVRRAVMTGLNQGAAKISIANCEKLGAEYVVISAHEGARTSDDPVANHLGWQGKIYKLQGSTKKYKNLEEATGFPNNPLGLCGYNCRHNLYPYFLGDPNPWEDIANRAEENKGSYEIAKKQRQMERAIRKSKQQLLGYQTGIDNCTDEKTKVDLQMEHDRLANRLQRQNKAYNEFCKEHDLVKENDRLRVAGWNRSTADKARRGTYKNKRTRAHDTQDFNTGKTVVFDKNKSYRIDLAGYSQDVCDGLSKSAYYVAEQGSQTRWEHCQLVNLKTGEIEFTHTDQEFSQVGGFYNHLLMHNDNKYAFIHNHNTDSVLSLPDMQILASVSNVEIVAAVRNDGIISLVEGNGKKTSEYLFSYYADAMRKFEKSYDNKKIYVSIAKEMHAVELAAEEFGNGVKIIGKD